MEKISSFKLEKNQSQWLCKIRSFPDSGILNRLELGLFGTLKLELVLQFIVTSAYFSVACNTKVSVRATLE